MESTRAYKYSSFFLSLKMASMTLIRSDCIAHCTVLARVCASIHEICNTALTLTPEAYFQNRFLLSQQYRHNAQTRLNVCKVYIFTPHGHRAELVLRHFRSKRRFFDITLAQTSQTSKIKLVTSRTNTLQHNSLRLHSTKLYTLTIIS